MKEAANYRCKRGFDIGKNRLISKLKEIFFAKTGSPKLQYIKQDLFEVDV